MGQKGRKQKSLLSIFIKTLAIILGVFAVFAGIGIGMLRYYLGGVERNEVNHEALQINQELEKYKEMKVVNIALFGVDANEGGGLGRSDAIMVASVDPAKSKIKLVSIARDTYVTIPTTGEKTKINHAYAYGGPELSMATINENFGLDITDYVSVDFEQLADIINELDGIELDITEEERRQINEYRDPSSPKLSESGYVHLNGEQAVAYSRIRKIGGDDARTNRQRKVLELLLTKLKGVSPLQYPSYIKKFSPMVETSMTDSEMLKLATVVMSGNDLELLQGAFPNENLLGDGETINGVWYYVYDLDEATRMLERFLYEDIPFEGLPEEDI